MKHLSTILISLLIAVGALLIYEKYFDSDKKILIEKPVSAIPTSLQNRGGLSTTVKPNSTNLTKAASITIPTVVYIRAIIDVEYDDWKTSYTSSTGSGVIISSNGFIVTNNHLIEKSSDIEIILNDRREYKAKLIGSDSRTDLALLKIEATDLPSINFADSDAIKIGQWVLAVGNPFRLQSTATAGIISAKARDIAYSGNQNDVNSYIQTDAAVNQGNSGGALVDRNGKLIGINTAIVTHSGRYEGYSFAIPSNVVLKVVEDIRQFGSVHRGLLGISAQSVNADMAEAKGLSDVSGVYVDQVLPNSAADEADLQMGDIILEIDGKVVSTYPEMNEILAVHRPGDTINVTIFRHRVEKSFQIELKNKLNTTDIIPIASSSLFKNLGFEVRNLTSDEKKLIKSEGVKVISIFNGSKIGRTEMDPGFIITKINDHKINDTDELEEKLQSSEGRVVLEGVYDQYDGTFWYVFNK